MSDTAVYLEKLGLTPTESSIYLSGLTQGECDIQTLLRATGIKRPTLYHALETLMQKGLVVKRGSERKRLFAMSDPNQLGRLLDRKVEELTAQKDLLGQIVVSLTEKMPKQDLKGMEVSHFEGVEGVKTVIEEALYCKARNWSILAPRKNVFSEMTREYNAYYLRTRAQRGIRARTLWEKETAHLGRLLTKDEIEQREPRYLPASFTGKFASIILLFDDKIALIHPAPAPSAHLIRSIDIHRLLLAIFDGIWEIAEPYSVARTR